ncbi:MAG: DUF952 domain-containing protein, partial [Propionibacteriaceae bacterium]
SRYDVEPTTCVFVDDSPPNVVAAAGLGLSALHFTDATQLREELSALGLLSDRQVVTEPLFHLTQRDVWAAAQLAGEFPWSTRDVSYDRQGYVHCSFRSQVDGVRGYVYADVDDADLVLLELDPQLVDVPIIVEDLGAGSTFPHLYGALPLGSVVGEHSLPLP